MSEVIFPCTKCGLCCKQMGKAVIQARSLVLSGNTDKMINEVAEFPHEFDRNSGRCSKLNDDNTCSIYETRPEICSIDTIWKKYHSKEMTLQQYHESTFAVCKSMMDVENNKNR